MLKDSVGEKEATVGSAAALPGDWPWEAVLLKDGRHICDATLVSSHWILTAASCFDGCVSLKKSYHYFLSSSRTFQLLW